MENSDSKPILGKKAAKSPPQARDWKEEFPYRQQDPEQAGAAHIANRDVTSALLQCNPLNTTKVTLSNESRPNMQDIEPIRSVAKNAMAQKKWSEAAAAWQRLLDLEGDCTSESVFLNLARAYRNSKKLDNAQLIIVHGLSLFGKSVALLREAAEIAIARGEWREAQERLEALIALEGAKIPLRVYLRLSKAYRQQGRFESANEILTIAARQYHQNELLLKEMEELKLDQDLVAEGFSRIIKDSLSEPAPKANSPLNEISIQQICECFWEIEAKYSLLAWEVNGIFPWPLVRMQLYYSITQKLGLFGAPHPALKAQSAAARAKVSKLAGYWGALERRVDSIQLLRKPISKINDTIDRLSKFTRYGNKQPRYALLMATRRVNGSEPYTDALRRELGDRALLLDRALDGKPLDGAYDFISLQSKFQSRYKRPEHALFAYEHRLLCAKIRHEIFQRLGVDVGDLATICQRRVADFIPVAAGFKDFFAKNPISILFLTNAYSLNTSAALHGARLSGAHIVELQHGFISPYHLGYSWPGRPEVPYRPDELWCFGDFWHESTQLPGQTRARAIGAPYVHELAKAAKGGRQENLVVFTSQGVIGRRLFDMALETARRRLDKRIVFRLHPSESLADYEAALQDVGSPPANFEISHRTPNIFALLATTAIQVGAFSTTLFEGMSLGCRTVVLDLPGLEYMRPAIERGDVLFVRDVDELVEKLDTAPLATDPEYYYAKPAARLIKS